MGARKLPNFGIWEEGKDKIRNTKNKVFLKFELGNLHPSLREPSTPGSQDASVQLVTEAQVCKLITSLASN